MTDMQFCKAQLRAAKAKTDLIGESVFDRPSRNFAAAGVPNNKPQRTWAPIAAHGLQVRCLVPRARSSGRQRATSAPGEQGVQFTAPSRAALANRNLGSVEYFNSNGEVSTGYSSRMQMNSRFTTFGLPVIPLCNSLAA